MPPVQVCAASEAAERRSLAWRRWRRPTPRLLGQGARRARRRAGGSGAGARRRRRVSLRRPVAIGRRRRRAPRLLPRLREGRLACTVCDGVRQGRGVAAHRRFDKAKSHGRNSQPSRDQLAKNRTCNSTAMLLPASVMHDVSRAGLTDMQSGVGEGAHPAASAACTAHRGRKPAPAGHRLAVGPTCPTARSPARNSHQ